VVWVGFCGGVLGDWLYVPAAPSVRGHRGRGRQTPGWFVCDLFLPPPWLLHVHKTLAIGILDGHPAGQPSPL
jgi:hypothetical protein